DLGGCTINEWNCVNVAGEAGTITLGVTADKIAAIKAGGYAIDLAVYGIIIESAVLKSVAEPTPTPNPNPATYDFTAETILDTLEEGKVALGALVMNEGTGALVYNGNQHGVDFAAGSYIEIYVGGPVKIEVGDCAYSGNTSLTLTNEDGTWSQTAVAKQGCYHNDGSVALFYYTGDATKLVLKFEAKAYVPHISVTPVELYDEAQEYDFVKNSIVGTEVQVAITEPTTKDALTINPGKGNYYYNDTSHGTAFKNYNSIELLVTGPVKVEIADCQYNNISELTMTSANNEWTQTVQSTKTCGAYMTFTYDKEEASVLVLKFDNTAYVTYIKVTPIAE
ncbi:MAG: hypothetical protein J6J44_04725, partial [Lachnospiraceae bacterium]|nr:hypothetical protein [Lachnospiraceae bacterium]